MAFLQKIRTLIVALLLPVLTPVGMIFGLFDKGRKISPKEFADLLRRVGDDTIGDEWDAFECVPLRDKRLEDIRLRAFPFCGRPGPVNREALYALAAETEALPPLPQ